MRSLAMTLSAGFMLAAAVFPAQADTQSDASGVPVHRPNATMLAKKYKCGGEELQCGGNLAKVCNLRNGKCCCLIVGTYH
jgi:hypothetical protein